MNTYNPASCRYSSQWSPELKRFYNSVEVVAERKSPYPGVRKRIGRLSNHPESDIYYAFVVDFTEAHGEPTGESVRDQKTFSGLRAKERATEWLKQKVME